MAHPADAAQHPKVVARIVHVRLAMTNEHSSGPALKSHAAAKPDQRQEVGLAVCVGATYNPARLSAAVWLRPRKERHHAYWIHDAI